MKKSVRTAVTTATAMAEYIDEITVSDAEIDMVMAEIEAKEMAIAEAMDAALAAMIEAEEQHRRELWEVLQTMDRSDPLYSDLYKDVYGFRPR